MMDMEHAGLLQAVKAKIDELDALIKHGMTQQEKPPAPEGSPAEEAGESPAEEAGEPADEGHPGHPGLMILMGHMKKKQPAEEEQ